LTLFYIIPDEEMDEISTGVKKRGGCKAPKPPNFYT